MHTRQTRRCHARRLFPAAMLAACCAMLPGCIVYDIRDELRTTNFRLSSLETELEELQRTNQRLELVRTQLQILERIQISLASLDDHLAAVRVVISSMSSMMSLLDFSPDEPVGPDGEALPDSDGAEESPHGDAGEATPASRHAAPRLRRKTPPEAPEDPPAHAPAREPGAEPGPR